ncbi:MAG: hypothetical protein HYY76_09870 [Acidobacteria bacterium]|nr:hypothetical protein [Acidobacteriota bacterium]
MDYLTKEDLRAAIAPLPTREEMNAAIALLATREEMNAAIALLATREEMNAAIAPLATREEMNAAIAAAIAPLATREEMYGALARYATREEMREEGERTRRHMDVLVESLRDDIRLLAEGQVALHHRIEDVRMELKADIAALDRRLSRLEARRA